MRKYGQVDSNQREIVSALRAIGCSVLSLAPMGNGCLDLLVGYHGLNFLLEVKVPGGKLTPDQEKFFATWRGQAAKIERFEDALRILNVSFPALR